MKDLNDKAYRQELTERYLNAETSIEEEKALANFYKTCKLEDLTKEELDIRNLMLGVAHYAQSLDMTSEDSSLSHQAPSKTNIVRISAVLLAAAMITGLIFMIFPVKDMFSSKPQLANLVPSSQVVRATQSPDVTGDAINPLKEMERQDSLFLAATKDIVVPQKGSNKIAMKNRNMIPERKNLSVGIQKKSSTSKPPKTSFPPKPSIAVEEFGEENDGTLNNDFNHYYEVASLALPSAEQLKIDQQDGNIVITTTDVEGHTQSYTIDASEAQDGIYQLRPLAQTN